MLSPMTTAQAVIKTLMKTLDNATHTGISALDEAIRACSAYSSTQDLINHFVNDCRSASSFTARW